MAKKTIFLEQAVAITIGAETYAITVKRSNGKTDQQFKAFRKAQEKKAKAEDALRKAHDKTLKKLNRLRADLKDNQELFTLEEEADIKKELLLERRELRAKIDTLESETEGYEAPDIEAMLKRFDALPKKQFEVLVGGEDKEKLEALLLEYENISYTDLWGIINENIAEAHKKK